ncbi:hypothetical protein, partial [Vibrio mediterranei]|uniref:hypothetical protein n=1 Tax=Vibrio mediterranei TaxID=689 RepID=UPI0040681DC0
TSRNIPRNVHGCLNGEVSHFGLEFGEHGWKNVRGGFWCDLDEESTKKKLEHHRLYIEVLGFDVSAILRR